MTDVLLVAGALIFEAEWDQVGPGFVPDRLARRFARARQTPQVLDARWSDGAAHLEWLARAFRVPGDPPAAAAFAWRAVDGAVEAALSDAGTWFCDPVHLNLEPERTVLVPIDAPPLTDEESRELFDEAADSARNHGVELRRAAGRWYLFTRPAWELRTTPLAAALGASVETRLPQGPHASLWRRLLNEVQMRWHASRVNCQRETRGQQTANGLWLHGGGSWRPLDRSSFGRVDTDDPAVVGWQQAGRPDGGAPDGSLIVWPHLFEPYWRRDWRAWSAAWVRLDSDVDALLQSARPGSGGRIELVACGRHSAATFALDRTASWLPWRSRPLRQCLLEPAR